MPHFTKRIKTDFGNPEFFFNSIFTPNGTRYHVTVFDKNKKVVAFNMEPIEAGWRISNSHEVPEWIKKSAGDLSVQILLKEAVD